MLLPRHAFLLCIAAVCVLFGCSQDPQVAPALPPEVRSFTASPSALELGEAQVELRWEVANAAEVVIDPLPGTFPTSGSIQVYVERDTTFVLRASGVPGGVATARAEARVVIDKVSIEGAVINTFGVPESGLEVSVNGEPAGITDGSGVFTASNVQRPYTVRLESPKVSESRMWDHLTTTTPTLVAGAYQSAPDKKRYFVRLSWCGGVQAPAGLTTVYALGDADSSFIWFDATPEASEVLAELSLRGPDNPNVDLLVIQMDVQEVVGDYSVTYERFAFIPNVQLALGTVVDVGAVPLVPIETEVVDVTLNASSWFVSGQAATHLSLPGRQKVFQGLKGSRGDNVVHLEVPQFPPPVAVWVSSFGAGAFVEGYSEASFHGRVPLPSGSSFHFDLLDPPVIIAPQRDQRRSPSSAIEWSSNMKVCELELEVGTASARLMTDRTSLTPAWLKRWGFDGNGDGSLLVTCFEGFESVDSAATAPADLLRVMDGEDGTRMVRSRWISFETAP